MITFREIGYWGRLGNQMFQFAACVGISRKIGAEAKFPIENCFVFQRTGPFDPVLGSNIDVRCELLHCFDIPGEYFIPGRHLRSDRVYSERDFTFDSSAFQIPDFTAINGYFQTEKYFAHCQDEIRKIFTFKEEILKEAESFKSKINFEGKEIVSLHVRRTDYVHTANHHPPCPIEYYNEAMSRFNPDNSIYMVFSDDPDWCKQNLSGQNLIFSELQNSYQEMCCMSLCDHHIIANSSFSWWGAWLNPSPTKKVVAPSRWFGPALPKDTRDVYSDSWIKI